MCAGMLVCDEGHRLKSTKGSRTLTALNNFRTKYRILITGTPVQNDLTEFWWAASRRAAGARLRGACLPACSARGCV